MPKIQALIRDFIIHSPATETEYDIQRVCGLDKGGPGVRSVTYSEVTFTMVHERAESPAKQTGQVHSILYLTNRMRTTNLS